MADSSDSQKIKKEDLGNLVSQTLAIERDPTYLEGKKMKKQRDRLRDEMNERLDKKETISSDDEVYLGYNKQEGRVRWSAVAHEVYKRSRKGVEMNDDLFQEIISKNRGPGIYRKKYGRTTEISEDVVKQLDFITPKQKQLKLFS